MTVAHLVDKDGQDDKYHVSCMLVSIPVGSPALPVMVSTVKDLILMIKSSNGNF